MAGDASQVDLHLTRIGVQDEFHGIPQLQLRGNLSWDEEIFVRLESEGKRCVFT